MEKADLIIKSSAVFTGSDPAPRPGAVVVKGNSIVHVVSAESAQKFIGPETECYDAGDGLVMAGFHDAHMHFFPAALFRSPEVTFLGGLGSEEECVSALLPAGDKVPEDQWLLGVGWRHGNWQNRRLPNKKSLDRLFPHRPVCMIGGDLHSLWLNDVGLKRLGLNSESRPVPGGEYGRFENGDLSGYIGEAAATDQMRRVLDMPQQGLDRLFTGFMRELNGLGITGLCDMSLTAAAGGDFIRDDVFALLEKKGKLTSRVSMFPTLSEDLSRPRELMKKHPGELLRCGGVKQFYDGVFSCHTAYLKDPYTDARFEGERGRPTVPDEEMRRLVLKAAKAGIRVRVHTIGDQAIHNMLDYLAEARELYGPGPAHCLEHLEIFCEEDIARLGAIGAVASVQPPHLTLDLDTVDGILGQKRVKLMWPFRSLLDAGGVLAFGTDCPVVEPSPLKGIYTAVTRQDAGSLRPEGGWNPRERISLAEALIAYTRGSAAAAGLSHRVGTLAAGQLADIAVLDRNPFRFPAEALLETKVKLTVSDGRIV